MGVAGSCVTVAQLPVFCYIGMMETKRCPRCTETKPWSEFYLRKTGRDAGRPYAYCRPCHSAVTVAWNKAHPAYSRGWEKDKYHQYDEHRTRKLARTRDWHARSQGLPDAAARVGPCDACGIVVPRVWDHNHATGQHRGWLCQRCNRVLGFIQDDPGVLEALSRYLASDRMIPT
jgi:hypothetical protein